MQRIVYNNPDGSIAIVIPSGIIPIEEVLKKDVPDDCKASAIIVPESEILTDRTFRNAWELKNKKIRINIDKAKEIHKNKLRAKRIILLQELDAEYIRALEEGKSTKEITDKKYILRNITIEVDKCNTIEEIQNIKIG